MKPKTYAVKKSEKPGDPERISLGLNVYFNFEILTSITSEIPLIINYPLQAFKLQSSEEGSLE